MISECEECKEKITTAKLLTKHNLIEGLDNQICKYIQCPRCDEIEEMEKFKAIYRGMNLHVIFLYRHRLSSIKNHIGIKTIEQQINKHSITFLRYVGHCLTFYHGPLSIYTEQIQQQMKRQIKNYKYIDLTILSFEFFRTLFLKRLTDKEAQFMTQCLYKLLFR